MIRDFYNLYNPSDKILNELYPFAEPGKNALGLEGSKAVVKPTNYADVNIAKEILDDDSDGDGKCDLGKLCPLGIGENHLGYWGFLVAGNHWRDDDAMNVVVDNWKALIPIKLPKDIIPKDIIPKGPIP